MKVPEEETTMASKKTVKKAKTGKVTRDLSPSRRASEKARGGGKAVVRATTRLVEDYKRAVNNSSSAASSAT
jgi:hypothetical protein